MLLGIGLYRFYRFLISLSPASETDAALYVTVFREVTGPVASGAGLPVYLMHLTINLDIEGDSVPFVIGTMTLSTEGYQFRVVVFPWVPALDVMLVVHLEFHLFRAPATMSAQEAVPLHYMVLFNLPIISFKKDGVGLLRFSVVWHLLFVLSTAVVFRL